MRYGHEAWRRRWRIKCFFLRPIWRLEAAMKRFRYWCNGFAPCARCGGEGSQYGLAPHKHDLKRTGSIIGSTVIEPKETWPENFHPDSEADGCGIWVCPDCEGSGVRVLTEHPSRLRRAPLALFSAWRNLRNAWRRFKYRRSS